MDKVLILMSTYNGGEHIVAQVESILKQKQVDIYIHIRDDGSDKYTRHILENIQKEYPQKICVEYGENIGWKRSFLQLVYSCKLEYDYYGFSDQDDIWFEMKTHSLIDVMKTKNDGVKLAHCNSISVDEKLKQRNEQEHRLSTPETYKMAIATECFQGCGMLWNSEAMLLIRKYRPQNVDLAHDYWVGTLCYLFGNIYFCKTPQFYHIRYKENSSEDGNIKKGRMKRLRQLLSNNKVYMNPCRDIKQGFGLLLNEEQKNFVELVGKERKTFIDRIYLFKDKDFKRPSLSSTLLFKFTILIGKY